MKKIFIFTVLINVMGFAFAETWQDYVKRVELMSDRVINCGFFEGDYWMDKLAAVWSTHQWCFVQFNNILNQDKTMTENVKARMELLRDIHSSERNRYRKYAVDSNSYQWVLDRSNHWYRQVNEGGLINFQRF